MITAADATIIRRRAVVALIAGAVTMLVLPATDLMLARPITTRHWQLLSRVTGEKWWGDVAIIGGPLLILAMLLMLRMVLASARMTPQQEGDAGDLTLDLGVPRAGLLNPRRIALATSSVIVIVMVLIGIHSHDLLAGLIRGLADAALCMTSFAAFSAYLGLRTRSPLPALQR